MVNETAGVQSIHEPELFLQVSLTVDCLDRYQ